MERASVPVQAPTYVKLDIQPYGDQDGAHYPSLLPTRPLSSIKKTTHLLHGRARKVAVVTILLSVVGWVLFVLSFGIYRNRYRYVGTIMHYPELYWAWIASIIGPVTFILALIHAVMWKRASAAIGSATALLGIAYTATMGHALVTCGVYTYEYTKYGNNQLSEYDEFPEYIGLMFAGSFISCFFWGITLALWPWYVNRTAYYKI